MAKPQKMEGSRYRFLRIRNTFLVFTSNGLRHPIENVHYYGPGPGMCGQAAWSEGQKANLITFDPNALAIPNFVLATGGTVVAGTAGVNNLVQYGGFQQTVAGPLNLRISKYALPNGIFAKWLDVTTDFDGQYGTFGPSTVPPVAATVGAATSRITWQNGGGVTGGGSPSGDRLPLDNHVTFRKFTGVAGREWSKGRWKFAPIGEIQTIQDELNSGASTSGITGTDYDGTSMTTMSAQTSWSRMKALLYSPITDGTMTSGQANLIYPCLLSTKLSQLRVEPTRIVYAPLVLPGLDYINNLTNDVINLALGEQRRRKEKSYGNPTF